jgi:transposase
MDISKRAGYYGNMRPNGTYQQLEKRRLQAIAMLESGKSYQTVANSLSASLSSVVRWVQAYCQEGRAGLKAKPIPGRPARLSVRDQAKLERILLKGPLQAGYPTDLWTLRRVAEVIEQRFQVSYHPGHVWKLLVGMGWSCQKPEGRSTRRDEPAIEHWKRYTWPRIKKSPKAWRPLGVPR